MRRRRKKEVVEAIIKTHTKHIIEDIEGKFQLELTIAKTREGEGIFIDEPTTEYNFDRKLKTFQN